VKRGSAETRESKPTSTGSDLNSRCRLASAAAYRAYRCTPATRCDADDDGILYRRRPPPQPGPGGFGDLLGLGGFGVLSGAGDSVGLAVASGVGSGVGLGVRWGVGAGVGTWVGAGVGAGVALSVGSAEVSTAPPAGVDGGCVRSVSFGDTLGGCDVAGAVGDDVARRD
jgi:hypothetical protein